MPLLVRLCTTAECCRIFRDICNFNFPGFLEFRKFANCHSSKTWDFGIFYGGNQVNDRLPDAIANDMNTHTSHFATNWIKPFLALRLTSTLRRIWKYIEISTSRETAQPTTGGCLGSYHRKLSHACYDNSKQNSSSSCAAVINHVIKVVVAVVFWVSRGVRRYDSTYLCGSGCLIQDRIHDSVCMYQYKRSLRVLPAFSE